MSRPRCADLSPKSMFFSKPYELENIVTTIRALAGKVVNYGVAGAATPAVGEAPAFHTQQKPSNAVYLP